MKPNFEICEKCPNFYIHQSVFPDPLRTYDYPYADDQLDSHVLAPMDETEDQIMCALYVGYEDAMGYIRHGVKMLYPNAYVPDDCNFKLEYIMKAELDAAKD